MHLGITVLRYASVVGIRVCIYVCMYVCVYIYRESETERRFPYIQTYTHTCIHVYIQGPHHTGL
jgi:hypothetical protein